MVAKIEAGDNWHSNKHPVNGVTLPNPYTISYTIPESTGGLKCYNNGMKVSIATRGEATGLVFLGQVPWGSEDLNMEGGNIVQGDTVGFPPVGVHYQLDSNGPVWQFGKQGTADYLKVVHVDPTDYLKEGFLKALSLNPPGLETV